MGVQGFVEAQTAEVTDAQLLKYGERLSDWVIGRLELGQDDLDFDGLVASVRAQAELLLRDNQGLSPGKLTPENFMIPEVNYLTFKSMVNNSDKVTIVGGIQMWQLVAQKPSVPATLFIWLILGCGYGGPGETRLFLEKTDLRYRLQSTLEYQLLVDSIHVGNVKLIEDKDTQIESLKLELSTANSLVSTMQADIDMLTSILRNTLNGSDFPGTQQSLFERTQSLGEGNSRDEFAGDLQSLTSIAPESAGSGSHF